jgi:GT2 family glycosyltransferase
MTAPTLSARRDPLVEVAADVGPARPGTAVSAGVALVNWNRPHDTIECLESLLEADPLPARVVVVDNGSADDSLARMARWAAERRVPVHVDSTPDGGPPADHAPLWLTVLASVTNRGFSGGNNLALRWLAADARLGHFLLLNNDATVARDFFAEVAAALREVPLAGLLSGSIYEFADRSRVWYAGGYEVPYRALVLHSHAVPAGAAPIPTEFICGCSMLISRAAYDTLGPLPECYDPGYCEDAEYSIRARKRGFSLIYAPRAAVYHKVGATFGGSPFVVPRVAFLQNRNRVFYVRRNMRSWTRWAALAYLAITKPGRAVVEAVAGRPAVAWAMLRGMVTGFLSRAPRG